MDIFISLFVIGFILNSFTQREQQLRVNLLGSYLARCQVEKLMASLLQGYLRALDEDDWQRREQAWLALEPTEAELCRQMEAFMQLFAKVPETKARISKLPFALPYASQWLSVYAFDARRVFALHLQAIRKAAIGQPGQSRQQKAFVLMAELLLMRHSCHWFCRSRMTASARLLAQHQSSHQQVLEAVAPATRQAYLALVQ